MSSIEYTATAKSALRAMLEVEAKRFGSRMVAYERLAKSIGASPSWLQKFISDDTKVREPRYAIFKNITAYYDKICTRVEQERQIERMKFEALRVELDAIDQSFDRLVDRSTEAETR